MIDKIDHLILNVLQHDSSLSTHKIAKKTQIPQTTVLNRIMKLKASCVIKRYTVDVDYKLLDKKVKALIYVKVNVESEKKNLGKIGSIESTLSKQPNVLNIKRLMGAWDFVIEIVCKDVDELDEFLIKHIRSISYVADTQTVVVLNEWKGEAL